MHCELLSWVLVWFAKLKASPSAPAEYKQIVAAANDTRKTDDTDGLFLVHDRQHLVCIVLGKGSKKKRRKV